MQHVPMLVQMGASRGFYAIVALGPESVRQLAARTAESLADELLNDFSQAKDDVIVTAVRKVAKLGTDFLANGVAMATDCRDKITARLSKRDLSPAEEAVVRAQRDAIDLLLADSSSEDVFQLVADAYRILSARLEAGEGDVEAPGSHYAGRAQRREQVLAVRQEMETEVQGLAAAVQAAQIELEARRQQLAGLEEKLAGMKV
jgi:hypothetical protein